MSGRNIQIIFIAFGFAMLLLAGCSSPTAAPLPTAVPATAITAPTAAAKATTAPTASAVSATSAAPSAAGGAPAPNCGKPDCVKPGPAIAQTLKGDPAAGQKVFADNCQKCHGDQGKVGIDNPGSTDGTVPNLNPIDTAFSKKDPKAFAAEIDAFIEHGSTPDGPSPKNVMDAWGDQGKLTPQQIADVIAYVMGLNP